MTRPGIPWPCLLLLAAIAPGTAGAQQRVRLSQPPVTLEPAPSASSTGTPLVPVQTAPPPAYNATPSATMGSPTFDPYATTPNPTAAPPTLGTTSPSWSGGATPAPYSAAPYSAAPYNTAPYSGSAGTTIAPAPYAAPSAGGFTQQPPVLLPGAAASPMPGFNWPQPEQGRYMRFFQEVRARDTWLTGEDSPVKMETHDIEVATTVNFPNFFWSGRPLHVSPSFDLSLWDGPNGAGLPSKVYGAYLEFGWEPMLTPQFGADLDVSVGVFSDFNTISNDSLRIQGSGVALLNLTPTVTLKGGAVYLDRVDVQWLPAGGVLWQPNPRVRWDIYFPRPKLAQYLTTLGNTDIWWYLMGEYGGGSWTVQRWVNDDENLAVKTAMDINDLRVGGGFEWKHACSLRAFVELAYVFDREIVYDGEPLERYALDDTLMVRGGFAY